VGPRDPAYFVCLLGKGTVFFLPIALDRISNQVYQPCSEDDLLEGESLTHETREDAMFRITTTALDACSMVVDRAGYRLFL
jgi:hypothetical protein